MAVRVNRKALVMLMILTAAVVAAGAAGTLWWLRAPARAKQSLDEARLYAQRGDNERAIIQYKNAIKYDPENTLAYIELCDVYVKEGDLSNAYIFCKRASEKDPHNVSALSKLAWFYHISGNWKDLRQTASMVVTLAPGGLEEAMAHAYLGKAYYRDGDYKKAVEEFTRATQMNGDDIDSILALALIDAQRLNLPADAQLALKQLMDRASDASKTPAERARAAEAAGKFYVATGKPSDAEMLFKRAIEINPGKASHYVTLGDFYRGRGRDSASQGLAEAAYAKAAELDPRSSLSLGVFYRETGNRDKAIEVFGRAIAATPAPAFYQQIVEALLDKGDIAAAQARVDEARKEKGTSSIVDYLQGRVYLAESRGHGEAMRKAEDLFSLVAKRQPQFPFGHYYYGLCLSTRGMLDDAAEQFKKALELAPDMAEASAALAETYLRGQQLDKAIVETQRVLGRNKMDYHANLIAGRALMSQGNSNAARNYLMQARNVRPAAVDAYLALADLLVKEKKHDEALAMLADAVKNTQDSQRARMSTALVYQQMGRDADALQEASQLAAEETEGTSASAFYASLLWQQGRAEDALDFLARRAAQTGQAGHLALLGDFQRSMGRLDEALASYGKALAAAPGDAQALAGKSTTLVAMKRYDQARESLTALRASGPGSPTADLIEARILEAEGKPDAAAALLGNSIRQNPANAEAYYRLAVIEQARGDRDRAVENYRSTLKYNPGFVAARLALAQIYYDTNFYEDALREARVVTGSGADTASMVRAANISTGSLVEKRRISEAIAEWSQVPPEVKDSGDYFVKLGYLYLMDDKYDEAEQEFRKAAGMLAEPSPALEGLARAYLVSKRYGEANATARQALSQKIPDAARVRMLQLVANVSLLEGNREAAASALAELLAAAGDDAALLVQAGDSFAALGRRGEALDAYRRAVKADPKYLQARYRMVAGLMSEGQLEEAKRATNDILGERPNDFQSTVLKTQILIAQNKPEEAEMLLRTTTSAAAQGQDAAVSAYLLGQACFMQKKVAEADAHLRRALSADPAMHQARLLLAKVLLLNRSFEDAAVEARRIVKDNPASAEAYGILGDVAMFGGKTETAIENYRHSLSIEKKPGAIVALANVLTAAGRADEAVREMEAYLQAAPSDVTVASLLAAMHQSRKEYAAAEAVLLTALKAKPGDVAATRALAKAYKEEGKLAEAETLLSAALGNADFRDAHVLLAGIYDLAKKPAEAEKALRDGTRLYPDYLPNYEALALLLADANRVEEAAALMKRGIRDNSDNETFYLGMGRFYRRRNMAAEYESFLKDTIARHPAYANVACDLGDYYLQGGDVQKARAVYEAAVKNAPKNARAANALAYALAEQGAELQRAIELATMARDREPRDANIHDTLGWAYYRFGQYDKAVVSLAAAAQLAEAPSPTILYHLALSYEKIGASARARETAQRLTAADASYGERPDIKAILAAR